jgi:hypothetical protein
MATEHLGCWSCVHFLPGRCDLQLTDFMLGDLGDQCPSFDYEPGSDEAELTDQNPFL